MGVDRPWHKWSTWLVPFPWDWPFWYGFTFDLPLHTSGFQWQRQRFFRDSETKKCQVILMVTVTGRGVDFYWINRKKQQVVHTPGRLPFLWLDGWWYINCISGYEALSVYLQYFSNMRIFLKPLWHSILIGSWIGILISWVITIPILHYIWFHDFISYFSLKKSKPKSKKQLGFA